MTQYFVTNGDNFKEDFYSLSSAKKAMKEHNAKGYKYKIYSNGDVVNCGEISLASSNKTFIANSRMTKVNY